MIVGAVVTGCASERASASTLANFLAPPSGDYNESCDTEKHEASPLASLKSGQHGPELAFWEQLDGNTIRRWGHPSNADAKSAFHRRLNIASFVENRGRNQCLFFTVRLGGSESENLPQRSERPTRMASAAVSGRNGHTNCEKILLWRQRKTGSSCWYRSATNSRARRIRIFLVFMVNIRPARGLIFGRRSVDVRLQIPWKHCELTSP